MAVASQDPRVLGQFALHILRMAVRGCDERLASRNGSDGTGLRMMEAVEQWKQTSPHRWSRLKMMSSAATQRQSTEYDLHLASRDGQTELWERRQFLALACAGECKCKGGG
ncbi:hypothetical protein S40285_09900 [Stachybotrys chlorohalonatus IBT 40285]|uniref:Uncharacterized protein n=1 Tax=Stachybotrys chlorohalonatus (strain IBT 40285) TaxID=1283841 RepID=A0A084QR52_STAC4|nr:hypothetical protein S40285_09900 [Stachybotrys chlorohalonata IBT 40285]